MELKKDFLSAPIYIKIASILFILIALGYIVILAKEILSPLIFSCLFSILLLPLASFLERKLKFPRTAASMISVILLVIGVALIVFIVGSQISNLASDWPQFQSQLDSSLDVLQTWIANNFHVNESKQLSYVQSAKSKILSSGTEMVGATFLSLSSMLLFLIFTFIYSFFFLLYRSLIMKFLISVFLDKNSHLVHDIIEQVQYIIRKYIIGLLIEMGLVAGGVSIALWACGVQYAFLLGLITGLINIIPYIGIFTALVLSVIITFATATAASKVVLVIIIMVITHLVDSNILLPLIVGSKVRINALATVLGVIIGEMIWGIPGMFLSIPITAVLKIIFDRVEGLKPWGIILGDEELKHNKLAKARSTTGGRDIA